MLADERRGRRDRREQPRRRADLSSIAQVTRRMTADQTRLEVIFDGTDGMRLKAMFACGCTASEPIGARESLLRTTTCSEHLAPVVPIDRRSR